MCSVGGTWHWLHDWSQWSGFIKGVRSFIWMADGDGQEFFVQRRTCFRCGKGQMKEV